MEKQDLGNPIQQRISKYFIVYWNNMTKILKNSEKAFI